MGDPERNDGSIMRSDLDGKILSPSFRLATRSRQAASAGEEERQALLVGPGRDAGNASKSGRDGNPDPRGYEPRRFTAGSDQRKWCVGIAVDPDGGKFYWTQKGGHDAGRGRILRANIQVPQGQSAENRTDIELSLTTFRNRSIWTWIRFIAHSIGPTAGTRRAAIRYTGRHYPKAGNGKEPEILFTHLMEGIGLALDLNGGRMFFITDFGGSVYSANLDGSNRRTLLFAEGNLTGIAYAEVPSGN